MKFVLTLAKKRHVTVTSRGDVILKILKQMYPELYESKENKRVDVIKSKRTVSRRQFDLTNASTAAPKVAKHSVNFSILIEVYFRCFLILR